MKKDLTIVRKIAVDSMLLAWYVDNKFKFYLYSKDALYSELTKSTTTLGDYLSECLVGFLFARFKGGKVSFPPAYYRNFVRVIDTGNKALSKNELAGTYEQAKQEMYEAFQENDPASEITFFAVDSTLEGQRIESLFLDELINRYTDTGSTY